ncbi:MAG: Fe-S protein assembly co-chaperone HscB [Herminiimonas sp.]|nr:Fe-S protein assembly co-chaperone HscB [Herminiimonas sp.]
MQNHFALFHLPQNFTIDATALDAAYHAVQNQVHPDKFSTASDAEKRVAMQWATRANEAYLTLKSPLKRATYLCELHGIDLQTESNTSMPTVFLMQQMEWREALDDARAACARGDDAALEMLDAALREARSTQIAQIAASLDAQDFATAALDVRKLMFIEKFGDEVAATFDMLT